MKNLKFLYEIYNLRWVSYMGRYLFFKMKYKWNISMCNCLILIVI